MNEKEKVQTKIQRLQVKVTAIRKNPLLMTTQAPGLVDDLLSVCLDMANYLEEDKNHIQYLHGFNTGLVQRLEKLEGGRHE